MTSFARSLALTCLHYDRHNCVTDMKMHQKWLQCKQLERCLFVNKTWILIFVQQVWSRTETFGQSSWLIAAAFIICIFRLENLTNPRQYLRDTEQPRAERPSLSSRRSFPKRAIPSFVAFVTHENDTQPHHSRLCGDEDKRWQSFFFLQQTRWKFVSARHSDRPVRPRKESTCFQSVKITTRADAHIEPVNLQEVSQSRKSPHHTEKRKPSLCGMLSLPSGTARAPLVQANKPIDWPRGPASFLLQRKSQKLFLTQRHFYR